MPRTFIRPDTQIESSVQYNSALAPGGTLETGAVSLEDDLNALRSQISRLMDASGTADWYSDIPEVNGKKRALTQIASDLSSLEDKNVLARVDFQGTVAVPAGQNYVVLSAANGQTPSLPIALGTDSAGVVSARSAFNGAAFGAAETIAQSGTTTATPKNLVVLRDATTLQAIESGGFDVFGLFQVESTATDGHAIDDTAGGNRAKLSFVTINPANGTLRPAAAADIAGHSINYAYVLRGAFSQMPEQSFIGTGVFTDSISDVNITLTRAVANQAGSPVAVGSDLAWRVANGKSFKIQDSTGIYDWFAITSQGSVASGDVTLDSLNFSTNQPIVAAQGMTVSMGDQSMNLGVEEGVVSSSNLTLRSNDNDLALASARNLTFSDSYSFASDSISKIALSKAPGEWDDFQRAFGEKSLIASVVSAATQGSHIARWATVTAVHVPAGTVVSGAGATPNLSVQLPSYDGTANPISNVLVYVNGVLLEQGADASDTTADWYPVAGSDTGDLKFTFALRKGDKIAISIAGNSASNG